MNLILIVLMLMGLLFVFYLWRDSWKGLLLCCAAVLVGVLFGAKDRIGVNDNEVLLIGVLLPVGLYFVFKLFPQKVTQKKRISRDKH